MSPENESNPADFAQRRLFTGVHDKNISVIAPAGVGKTRGIVDRILEIAKKSAATDLLPRLVVVTYTQAAAQEMQSRARVGLRSSHLSPGVQRAFQQTFFGTIHSFCVRLLSRFGHYLGLPGTMTLPRSEDEIWDRFLIHGAARDPAAEGSLGELFHFYTVDQLYRLGHAVAPGAEKDVEPLTLPDVSHLRSFNLTGLHPSTKKAVQLRQQQLADWSAAWTKGDRSHPIPECSPNPPEFVQLWRDTFSPLNSWLQRGTLEFGRRVANDFAAFRLSEGVMTYDDQVRLALETLKTPGASADLRRERWSVLLDEAQDTDKNQFDVLSRVAGLPDGKLEQEPGQTFCIVGDFQQAIWAPRSDLDVYRDVHVQMLREGNNGASVELTVTFRCDHAIIKFVNTLFPPLLDEAKGQAKFVPLRSRDAAGEGQVARWTCPPLPARPEKWKVGERARHEARYLAAELARLQPAGLGADDWSDVAILCPRVDWLHVIETALRQADIDTQLHSGDRTQAGSTPRAWLAGLVWIAAHPEDRFEIAGVLRDILGVADDAMARFTGQDGELLRLDRPGRNRKKGEVDDALDLLRSAIEDVEKIPLHLAVRQLMDRTRLRDRVASLGEEAGDLVDRDFDEILAQVDRYAAEGATLAQLAEELRDSLGQDAAGGDEVRPGAVQLFSWHKAKGLEWQTVIVPFLYRSFGQKDSAYPRVIMRDGEQVVYGGKEHYEAEAKDHVHQRARQQFQRMLYVACTRPKHTLLLIDDAEVFADSELRNTPYRPAELLRLDQEPARAAWRALPEKIKPRLAKKKSEMPAPDLVPACPPLALAEFETAVNAAQSIPKRVTPHALAKHPSAEAEPEMAIERDEPSPDSPAIRYGTWWHEAMETLPWTKPQEAWDVHIETAIRNSPQPERSRHEWEILRGSELARWLATPGLIVHRELPFLSPEPDRCLEGVIDLAVFSPRENRWRVIDWKTNRTDSASLLEIYRGQVQAYVDAIHRLLVMPVDGGLYLTATGELTLLGT